LNEPSHLQQGTETNHQKIPEYCNHLRGFLQVERVEVKFSGQELTALQSLQTKDKNGSGETMFLF
jgi:hypothetical protein